MLTSLWVVIITELAAVVVLLVALFACTAVRSSRGRRRAAIESRWHQALRAEADGRTEPAAGLSGLSPRQRVPVIAALVGSLSGHVVAAVTGPTDLLEVRRYGAACTRSRWWWCRLRGVRTLMQLDEPPQAYRSMLADPRAEVRAEVAAWVARDPGPGDIDRLVAMLDSDVRGCRLAAENSLRNLGLAAVPALTQYLSGPGERTAVALTIASAAAAPTLLPVASRWSRDADPANRAASAVLLAAIGTDHAAQALVELLEDPAPQVRAAAAGALGEVGSWTAAPQLTLLLRDPDWWVRRSAAAGLRSLGPVGRLCLRRALHDADPRAVEIARHVLDLPEFALLTEAG